MEKSGLFKTIIFTLLAWTLCLAGVLVVAESAFRFKNPPGFENLILKEGGTLIKHHFEGLYVHDPKLGWVPKPNSSGTKWEKNITLLENGIRSNGQPKPEASPLRILTAGDSLTFGDEVADHETWPAYLESLTGYDVLNAGVSSYGFDQTILRAEDLAQKYKPDILIVGFIMEDIIMRLNQSVRHGVPKPYFALENGNLVLKNQPVPLKENAQLDLFRSVFGYSHFVHWMMNRLAPQYWWADTMKDNRTFPSNTAEVAVKLVNRLIKRVSPKTQIIFLVQAGIALNKDEALFIELFLKEVQPLFQPNVMVVNVLPELLKLKTDAAEEFNSLYNTASPSSHMSPKGNAFIAAAIKSALEQRIVP